MKKLLGSETRSQPRKGEAIGKGRGRPGPRKMPFEVKQALKALVPEAVETLKELLKSKDDRVRFAAAQAILDRELGKAPTPIFDALSQSGQPILLRWQGEGQNDGNDGVHRPVTKIIEHQPNAPEDRSSEN
jgi:hypothetical protein